APSHGPWVPPGVSGRCPGCPRGGAGASPEPPRRRPPPPSAGSPASAIKPLRISRQAPDPPPPLSLKTPPRPGQLRGASAQVTFPAAVTLGHPKVGEEGEKNSCSAQTFLRLKQRGFEPNPHP
ncbi:hypothetical protein Nmel_015512, partial [Mimus melanotis]